MRLHAGLAVVVLLLSASAQAGELPVRPAGEWQVTVMGPDGKPRAPRTYCYAARSVGDITSGLGECARNHISQAGPTTTIEASCLKDGHTIAMHMALTSAGETAYHARMHATYSPPIAGMSTMDMESDSKWLGPCPPGVQPVH